MNEAFIPINIMNGDYIISVHYHMNTVDYNVARSLAKTGRKLKSYGGKKRNGNLYFEKKEEAQRYIEEVIDPLYMMYLLRKG